MALFIDQNDRTFQFDVGSPEPRVWARAIFSPFGWYQYAESGPPGAPSVHAEREVFRRVVVPLIMEPGGCVLKVSAYVHAKNVRLHDRANLLRFLFEKSGATVREEAL